MQLRDERYLALLLATDRKYALPRAEEARREAEEIRNLRLALENKEYAFRLGPLRKLAPWIREMRKGQHRLKMQLQLNVRDRRDLLEGWDMERFRLYHRYLDVESGLSWLGGCFWNRGRSFVLYGADEGNWHTYHRGLGYVYWALRVHSGIREMAPWHSFWQVEVASDVAHALTFRRWAFATFFRDILLRSLVDQAQSSKPWWVCSPFTAFMIRLCQLWSGTAAGQARPTMESLGGYASVIDAWTRGGAELAKAINLACDFHCVRLRPRLHGEGDFDYDLVGGDPCEILAIYRIREQLGLDTPKIRRPLLDSPLANPPMHIPRIEDPLLDEVARKFCAEFSQEEGPWKS